MNADIKEEIRRLVKEARAAERERCALKVESYMDGEGNEIIEFLKAIAAAIRELKDE